MRSCGRWSWARQGSKGGLAAESLVLLRGWGRRDCGREAQLLLLLLLPQMRMQLEGVKSVLLMLLMLEPVMLMYLMRVELLLLLLLLPMGSCRALKATVELLLLLLLLLLLQRRQYLADHVRPLCSCSTLEALKVSRGR